MRLELHITLHSDTTFGRGDGVAGLVDQEVEHDAATGLPFIRGRSLKGLLVEECANILYAVDARGPTAAGRRLEQAAKELFGRSGSRLDDDALMHVGPATLPDALQAAVRADIEGDQPRLRSAEVLESLTTIRRQTAIDEETNAPQKGSLRSMRVLLRLTPLMSRLDFERDPGEDALALLAACVLALRRGGTGRNRGRGRMSARLYDAEGRDVTLTPHFARFQRLVVGGGA
jgi:hypothetical protein